MNHPINPKGLVNSVPGCNQQGPRNRQPAQIGNKGRKACKGKISLRRAVKTQAGPGSSADTGLCWSPIHLKAGMLGTLAMREPSSDQSPTRTSCPPVSDTLLA